MCGISGIIGEEDKRLVAKMCKRIAHRGPDDEGFYNDKLASIGNRRLSIIDLRKGHQPIHNEEEDVWIVYNGETYNHSVLRAKLKNHKFYTDSDTETLVHAYEEWGDNFIERLNGMYAFCIWDGEKKRALLGRDRVGVKPLYYTVKDGKLLFGSEIKCILEYSINRDIDLDALSCYLRYGSVFGESTLFKSVKKVLPGGLLIWESGEISKKRFWRASMNPTVSDEPTAVREVSRIVGESVQRTLMSDVPFGAFLSGGLDSSTVVGEMSKHVDSVETFSVGFGEADDELAYAKAIADHFGANHHELFVEEAEVPKIMDELVWHFDDLDGDAAAVPTYFVSKLARKFVKVVLTGEGGDEVFAGYNRYKPFSDYFSLIPKTLKVAVFENAISFFSDSQMRKLVTFNAPRQESKVMAYFQGRSSALNQALQFGIEEVLPNQLLMKVDKTAMAHSLEARVPLLDDELVAYGEKLAPNLKMHGLTGKYVLRKAVEKLVPNEIIKRRKHGFTVPIVAWFNGELGEFADGVFDRIGERKLFRRASFKEFVDRRASRKDAARLWHLLLLELWMKKFVDSE